MSNQETEEISRVGRGLAIERILRSATMALDVRKLIIALAALVLLWAGWDALGRVFPGSRGITPLPEPTLPLSGESLSWSAFQRAAEIIPEPVRLLGAPARELFRLGSGNWHFLHALLATIWAVVVLGVLGAAIARIAVVESATGLRIGTLRAVRYVLDRVKPLVLAPGSLALIIGFMAGICGLFGLLYRISGPAGEIAGGVTLLVPLVLGAVMLAATVGLVAGWPLMVVSVATEGEDALDALSRSFSYVFQRLLTYSVLVALAWAIGSVGLVMVELLSRGVVAMCRWGLSFGAPDARLQLLLSDDVLSAPGAGAAIHASWLALVAILVYAWVFSFFWCAMSQIYLLLRRQVDGTSLREIDQPSSSTSPAPAAHQ